MSSSITARGRADNDRLFYSGMTIAMAVTVFAGFAPSFFLKVLTPGAPPLSLLVHAHGAVFSAWMLLCVAQTLLVAQRRTDIHRQLGMAGVALAVLMVPLGVAVAVVALRTNHTPPGLDPRSFLVLPFFDLLTFVVLIGAGVYFRQQAELHKRLMLLGTLSIIDAGIARLPGVFEAGPLAIYGLQDVFLLACFAYDWASRRRIHPAYVWGGLFILVLQPGRLMLSVTPAWLAFGDWLKG